MVAAGLDGQPLDCMGVPARARVRAVVLETDDAVDDLRVEFSSGWTVCVQAKRKLTFAVLPKVVQQWAVAARRGLDPSRDRLVVAAGWLSGSMRDLREVLEARRFSIPGALTAAQAEVLHRVVTLLGLDDELCALVLRCAVVWKIAVEEPTQAGSVQAAVWLQRQLADVTADHARLGWTQLLHLAGMAARRRGGHDLDGWRMALAERGFPPKADSGELAAGVCPGRARQEPAQAGVWSVAGPEGGTVPAGWRRVEDTDPIRLGVHRPIRVAGVADDVLPAYVERDVDRSADGVRAKLAAAAERGGFVMLVGDSSVGKTRTAFEAVRARLRGWWLAHPSDAAAAAALVGERPSRLVVWLDEIQKYFDGDRPLTAGVIGELLDGPGPVVVVATIWPDRLHRYIGLPDRNSDEDRYRAHREVLVLADQVNLADRFSRAERDRAEAAARCDSKLRAALAATDLELTQTLAAAPQLVARWEQAKGIGGPGRGPYRSALLTAALDAARLGVRGSLSPELLGRAALGYYSDREWARAPEGWFDDALAYAIDNTTMHGAAAALEPVAGQGPGEIAGYRPADYLVQHATRVRRDVWPPARLWTALCDTLTDLDDLERVASAACDRRLYVVAVPLLSALVDDGDYEAGERLAWLLADAGDREGLATLADSGCAGAGEWLADLLADAGDRGALWARADAGDVLAADRLADLLTRDRDRDGLRALAEAGHGMAGDRLAALLAEDGDRQGAIDILEGLVEAGDLFDERLLNRLGAEAGDQERLRVRADAGDGDAADRLAVLLAKAGDRDCLHARAEGGDVYAAIRLAELHAADGDRATAVAILRERADAGDWDAASRLAALLADAGDRDGLEALADAGYRGARAQLARFLAQIGDRDALRVNADKGDEWAASKLNALLAAAGDHLALRERFDAADGWAARPLAELLAARGDHAGAIEILRALADEGDDEAGEQLAALLALTGDHEGLRARADDGDREAAIRLATLLAEAGDHEGLRARARSGDWWAAHRLAQLHAEAGDDRLLHFGFDVEGAIAERRGW
ncbi:hypothetical protein I6A62_05795 [Frankia sp. AgW1.1]|nr:hypothetical protein [Frankia sp. AgW1.1]